VVSLLINVGLPVSLCLDAKPYVTVNFHTFGLEPFGGVGESLMGGLFVLNFWGVQAPISVMFLDENPAPHTTVKVIPPESCKSVDLLCKSAVRVSNPYPTCVAVAYTSGAVYSTLLSYIV
jgi:hypothetical protein